MRPPPLARACSSCFPAWLPVSVAPARFSPVGCSSPAAPSSLPAWCSCLPAERFSPLAFRGFLRLCLLFFFLGRLVFVFFLLFVLLLLCVCRNTDSEGQRENCCADCSNELHKVLPPLSNRHLFLPYCKLPVACMHRFADVVAVHEKLHSRFIDCQLPSREHERANMDPGQRVKQAENIEQP